MHKTHKMTQTTKSRIIPLIIVTTLFFIFGFVTSLNGILMPHLKRACELSDFVSAFVPFAFFSAYFLFSIPSGIIIQKIGYKNGIVLGLVICFIGAMLFLPAANTRIYTVFLLALAILAAGITMLQVAANPYVALLGAPEKAASRISLVGFFNSLGGTISPLVGGIFILSNVNLNSIEINTLSISEKAIYLNNEAASVKVPYLILAGCLLFLAVLVYFSQMPNVDINTNDDEGEVVQNTNIFKHRQLVFGIIAIFMYVGAEVCIADFMIRYGEYLHIEGFTNKMGSLYLMGYGFAAMSGRFLGIFILPKVKSNQAIIFSSTFAVILVVISIFSTGIFALSTIVLIGLCNAVLWPSIFPLAISGLGVQTKKGSSLLIMAVVGGALIPLLFGYVSDSVGIQNAYVVTLLCYLYVLFYGIDGFKKNIK